MYQLPSTGLAEGAIIQKPFPYFTPLRADEIHYCQRWSRVGYIP